MKSVWLLVFCFSLLADGFPFPADSKAVSMATDSLGGRVAVWEEKGRILVSEMPLNGNWSMPSVLSSAMGEATSPQLKIDSKGEVIVTWVEGEKRKRVSKSLKEEWVFKGEEDFSFRSEALSVEKRKKRSPIKRTIQPLANAIDAPTSSVLSGAQIGFAAGTAAPANGLVVSGISGFGTSAVVADAALPAQIDAIAATERYFGANKAGTYGLLVGYSNATFLALTGGIIRNVPADPLYIYVSSTTQAAQFSALGELGLNVTPSARLHVRSPSTSTSNQYVFYNTGEIISTSTIFTAGEAIDVFLSPSNTVNIGATLLLFPKFAPSGAVTLGAGLYIDAASGSGTATNLYSIYAAKPVFGTNRYCAYLEGPVGIGTAAPLNQLDVTTGVAIGSFAGVNTAPSNGLIVSGQLGVGTANPGTSFSRITSTTPSYYSLTLDGSTQGLDGVDGSYGMVIATNMTGNAAGGFGCISLFVNPLFTAGGGTPGSMSGLVVAGGTSTTTPTLGYGIFIEQPNYGATAYAANIQGGMVHMLNEQSGNYTITTADYYVGFTGTSVITSTFTLPNVPPTAGWTVIIKDQGGNTTAAPLTIDGDGNNIDNAGTTQISTDYGVVRIYSNGTQYYTW